LEKEKRFTTTCSFDCGARCWLKVDVAEGKVKRIETDERPMPSLKACPRGLAQRDIVHAPDRLTRPLRRVGPRGEGKFSPISWDEALSALAQELQRVKEAEGPTSIFLMDYSGSQSPLHGTRRAGRRFFGCFGGCTTVWGNTSQEAALFSSLTTFGTFYTRSSRDNFLYSKLIVLWGWNPLITRFGVDTGYFLSQAKKAGIRIIGVDPRKSPSIEQWADEWIPIRPGTDAAMLIAMAYVVIAENLHDRSFIERYTLGFDRFADYVLGKEDGVAKTPGWAEGITGVPKDRIVGLAREYARAKPAALYAGWAPGRTAFGEQYHRAASTLAALTGNIGIPGGYVSGGSDRMPLGILGRYLPVPECPMPTVHVTEVYDALLHGKQGGYPSDIRILYIVGCNLLNQFPNLRKGLQALQKVPFIVVHELFLTPTARWADILLPVSHSFEKEDLGQPWIGDPYFIAMPKILEPLGEAKSDLEIFTELSRRLGLRGFNEKRDEEWLKEMVEATPGLPPYESLKARGVYEIPIQRPWVAFREQIENPDRHPFPTPSGKIEIYSPQLAEKKNPLLPPIPQYIPPWEGPGDPRSKVFPLQLISPHARGRVNSMLDNIPTLRTLNDQTLWIHPQDAKRRGIRSGDSVRVFNDRGDLITSARVTDGIMPGVVSLDAGAWYRPNEKGTDLGGCVNILTRDQRSPAGALASNSCLVEVEIEKI